MFNTDMPSRAELPSSAQLLRSTVLAAFIAALVLVLAVLPAEFAIDPTGAGRALGLTQMGEIKQSLAQEARRDAEQPPAPQAPAMASMAPAPVPAAPVAPALVATGTTEAQQHTTQLVLKPGEAAEVKLSMRKGGRVRYEWNAAGGALNFDTHGDPVNAPKGFYHGYGKGKNEAARRGELVAAFDGKHGWFWRNRSDAPVTLTLHTQGDYAKLERVL